MNYIEPNRNAHTYVIGIDFGHGETSADICNIQWNDTAGQLKEPKSIELFGGEKTIKSVLLIKKSGDIETHYIGQNAIMAYIEENLPEESKYFYAYFKKVPSSMSKEERNVICIFMKEVYQQILRQRSELTDNNHLVYIACPSNPNKWTNEELSEYAKIALDAGIPLAGINNKRNGIIRESRAAFIKARKSEETKAAIKEGFLLIDFGSSTVDLTYYSSNIKRPIDYGYGCGASNVEYLISEDLSKRFPKVTEAINTDKTVETAIRLKIRSDKEMFYSWKQKKMGVDLNLSSFTHGRINDKPDYYYSNEEISKILSDYIKSIKESFIYYRDNFLIDKPIELVYMTGGASRMDFIQDIVREVFNCKKIHKDGNPSLTISNGIALVGRADLRTYAMENELLTSGIIKNADFATKTVDKTASAIAECIISLTEECYSSFVSSSYDGNLTSLESDVKKNIESIHASKFLTSAYNYILMEVANDEIIPSINKIVKDYFPDFEIEPINSKSFFSLSVDSDSIKTLDDIIKSSLKEIEEGIIELLGKFLWNIAAGAIVGVEGLAINTVIWGINQFRDKKIDYVDIKDAMDGVTFDFRDKDTKLSLSRRESVRDAFVKNKEIYKRGIDTDVKNKIKSFSPLVNHINEAGREEIKIYISQQIDETRMMLN